MPRWAWYFLGVGIGFFAYALYAGILSLLLMTGKIKSFQKYEVAVSCGAAIERFEAMEEFKSLLTQWGAGKIHGEAFKLTLPAVRLTRLDYVKLRAVVEPDVSAEVLERFESGGYLSYLPERLPA